MAWTYDEADDRVRTHLAEMGEITVERLVREMDFDNLTETNCRIIFAAHVYGEIKNLSRLVAQMTDLDSRRQIVQATHLWQREVAHIIGEVGGRRINFQGGRAHAVIYRPISDSEAIATKAVLIQMILDRLGIIFSAEFPDLPDLVVRSGSDMGDAIGTRNGSKGDRELLFLGAPANKAAKLLPLGSDRRVAEAVYDAADDDVSEFLEKERDAEVGEYRIVRPDEDELAILLEDHGTDWTPDGAGERLRKDKVTYPASSVGIHETTTKIRFDDLSYTNSKLVEGATLYADVSGFTAYVGAATTDGERKQALRSFHAIRREMATVVRKDHEGVRVQFQGDRVQGIIHLPADDADRFCDDAVRTAADLQSSFEHVLKAQLPDIAGIGLAVGISQGTTIAAKLGEYAHRDRICLGTEVLRAEENEERVGKFQIGISGNVKEHLTPELAKNFEWDPAANCHVATGLDHKKIELQEAAAAYSAGKTVSVITGATGPIVSTIPGVGRTTAPSRNWGGR